MLTIDDLTQDLVWTRLLRAGVLAFHPVRLFVSLVVVAIIGAVFWALLQLEASLGWAGTPDSREHFARLLHDSLPSTWQGPGAGERITDAFFSLPLHFLRVHPLVGVVGVPVAMLVAILAMGALSRMAATEFTAGRSEPIFESLSFARERINSLAGAVLGPFALVWFVAFVLAAAGFLFDRWPGVNLFGAVFYFLALALGFFAIFILFVYAVGKPLLIPAVCCDGADALDSIQRAYAYVLAKPLRLAVYLAILVAQGFVLVSLVAIFCAAGVAFTARASGHWAGESGQHMVHAERVPERAPDPSTPTPGELPLRDRLFNAGAAIVRAWDTIPAAIPFAFLFSYSACAGTLLYLGMRRICDGQDMSELWSPQEDRAGALGAGSVPAETDADAE
jgi:hypothetical protein